MELLKILRKNIAKLTPYSCARDEFQGEASVFLDANENPNDTGFNRYPDPLQRELKAKISQVKNVKENQIFLGNGSDEPIDLLYRAFCEPGRDNVVAIEPTYGMYKVCAEINDVEYRKVNLDENFQFSAEKILQATDENTKIVWLCSPNNPTGNLLETAEIERVLEDFKALVVVDEAYIDFADCESWTTKLAKFPNLIVLQTLSKAWGCAALRLGMAFASAEIVLILNKIKYPYNINILTQRQALAQLEKNLEVENWVKEIVAEREKLKSQLLELQCVKEVFASDANFLLVKVENANFAYKFLTERGIIVRNRHNVTLCGDCLRLTVGLAAENRALISALGEI